MKFIPLILLLALSVGCATHTYVPDDRRAVAANELERTKAYCSVMQSQAITRTALTFGDCMRSQGWKLQ